MKAKRAKKETSSSAQRPPLVKKRTRPDKAKAKSHAAPRVRNMYTDMTKVPARKEPIAFSKDPFKGTFNTHDLMHSPVEKTIRMLEKIISGERLFTM